MKECHVCPKCGSREVAGFPSRNPRYGGVFLWPRPLRRVGLTRYVCLRCGYAELWVDGREELEQLRRSVEKGEISLANMPQKR